MAVSNLVAPSSGLSASDLITSEKWTAIGGASFGTLTGNANYTLTGISGYSKLRIFANGFKSASSCHLRLRINNDSSAIYHWLGTKATPSSGGYFANSATEVNYINMGYHNFGGPASSIITIDSANTTFPKFGEQYYSVPDLSDSLFINPFVFNNTAAISSLYFYTSNGSLFTDGGHINNGIFVYGAN